MKIALLCGLLAIALCVPAQDSRPLASGVDSFDAPLKKKAVDFGPSPYYGPPYYLNKRAPHIKLSCFYFPTFMVKEYDEGQKGAEWFAIVPVTSKELPACAKSHERGEKLIGKKPGADDWCGYFKGAKENLVFFNACDGTNGGWPFIVYDSTNGKKVFEDSAYQTTMWTKRDRGGPFDHLRVGSAQGNQLSLRYLRVVEADCDLHIEKAACWDRIKAKLNLKNVRMPVCTRYPDASTRLGSVVAYPVEVSLSPQPAIKTIAGPVKCWPPD